MATSTTTSSSRKVSAVRRELLAEVAVLKAAISDPNALMAGGPILTSLQRLEELRGQLSEVAQAAHTEWCARNL